MKKYMKENVANVYWGDPIYIISERGPNNSFSKAMQEFDEYPCSKELIGETDPDVQSMGMRAADVYKMLELSKKEITM